MTTMTYCINSGCPFRDYKNHIEHAPKKQKHVIVSNMDGTCKRRRYLSKWCRYACFH